MSDQAFRDAALDISQSFCVTAPAGSGKTELLTQRFLSLLAVVDEPEQILAITFTRKARAEMRQRVVNSLRLGLAPEPQESYQQGTWRAAQKALARDAQQQWGLLANPNRLRIQTIDSLNHAIAGESPLMNGFGSVPVAVNDASLLYSKVIQRLLNDLASQPALEQAFKNVLLAVNGDIETLRTMLATLLAKRDQWLSFVVSAGNSQTSAQLFEQNLQQWLQEDLHAAYRQLMSFAPTIVDLADFASHNGAPVALASLAERGFLPEPTIEHLHEWQTLAQWLLTGKGQFRAKAGFKAAQGFPAQSATKDKALKARYSQEKDNMAALIVELKAASGVEAALATIQILPTGFNAKQSTLLSDLMQLLKQAVAHLTVIFAETGECDHVAVTQSALNLLTGDTATANQIVWHNRVHHILVDEFQDTSVIQNAILERLTGLWQEAQQTEPERLRSLFIVGDGMQSIYRFRAANVGLFIQARREGIGSIDLASAPLSRNFRSSHVLVDWFNQTFTAAFPSSADASVGAVPYEQAEATKTHSGVVQLHGFEDDQDGLAEAAFVASEIKILQASAPNESIAVLVRSRKLLVPLIAQLQQHEIAYVANDIQALAAVPTVIDLMSLTCWVLDYNDDIALAAILRAPWCGASLDELQTLREGLSESTGWFVQLHHTEQWQDHPRFAAITQSLNTAYQQRQRKNLADTVEGLWQALAGHYCADDERDYAEQYFSFLRTHSDIINNADSLENSIRQVYAKPQAYDHAVNLMTIHKSKGLQFDSVFLMGVGRGTKADQADLLHYAERLHNDGSSSFLLAPWGKTETDKILANYLNRLDKAANKHEALRVLYVAATRAVSRLYLSFSCVLKDDVIKAPTSQSLLSYIWPSVKDQAQLHGQTIAALPPQEPMPVLRVKRLLTPSALHEHTDPAVELDETTNSEDDSSADTELGQIVHEVLELLAKQGEGAISPSALTAFIGLRLRNASSIDDKAAALSLALEACNNAMQTELGQWILFNGEAAYNEWSITTKNSEGHLSRNIIDRSFIKEGVRWIIDYKMSQPKVGQSVDAFLAGQSQQYQSQLQRYYRVVTSLPSEAGIEIKTALYFPLINTLHETN